MSETASQPPARVAFKKLRDCRTLQEAFQTDELKSLIAAAAPKFIDPAAMLRTWIQAASRAPLIYQAEPRQALGAFQSLAFLGLQPNTHLQLAHIIPFKRTVWNPETRKRDKEKIEIQVIIGYPGYIELAHRSGAVKSLHCDVVFDPVAEQFSYEYGTNQHLRHCGQPPGFTPKGSPLYAYAHFRMADGDQFEVMPWSEVEKIRGRSQGYRTAIAAREEAVANNRRVPLTYTEAPWVRDPEEMGKKTALRRGVKWVPRCPELRAAHGMEAAQDEGGTLDWGPVIDGQASPLDGDIPQAEPAADEPRDPTAAASMQKDRPSARESAADAAAGAKGTKGKAAEAATSARREPRQPGPKVHEVPPEQAGFEAGLVDEYGELASDLYTDATQFAAALVEHWRKMPDKALTEELLRHNADALMMIDAQWPAASAAIAAIQPPEAVATDAGSDFPGDWDGGEDAGESSPDSVPAAVAVPERDGKPDWPAFAAAVKEAAAALPQRGPAPAEAWAEAQREALTQCPAGPRLIAINAVSIALGAAGVKKVPDWLAELVKPKDPDRRLVDGFGEVVKGYLRLTPASAAMNEFLTYTKSGAIQAAMKRLRETRPELFSEAEKLFQDAYDKLQEATQKERP